MMVNNNEKSVVQRVFDKHAIPFLFVMTLVLWAFLFAGLYFHRQGVISETAIVYGALIVSVGFAAAMVSAFMRLRERWRLYE